jgi:hypothetical protein
MIPQGAPRQLSVLIALIIAGCSQPDASRNSTTTTVNLARSTEIHTIECEAAFAGGGIKTDKADDGSTWAWVKGKDGTLSHYCRMQPNGAVSAWAEASRAQKATHSLIYRSDAATVRFVVVGR